MPRRSKLGEDKKSGNGKILRAKDSPTKYSPTKSSPTEDLHSPKLPLFGRRERQIRRFYEPLVLLETLGTTRGERTTPISNQEDLSLLAIKDLRRRFLTELAYVCDYDKGGDTVTAIGLEATPQGYVFWVAANTCPVKKVIPFLRSLLLDLKGIAANSSELETHISDLAKTCIEFARLRIKKYLQLIRKLIRECSASLQSRKSDEGKCNNTC